jgi:hypothetical protein
MEIGMTWALFALFNGLIIAAYYVGKDAGIDEERTRNARRRAHQHNTRKEHNQ